MRLPVYALSFALIAIGIAAFLDPKTASTMYGLSATSAVEAAFMQAAGVRDVSIGLMLLCALRLGVADRTLAAAIASLIPIPLVDAFLVARNGEVASLSFALHAISIPLLGLLAMGQTRNRGVDS